MQRLTLQTTQIVISVGSKRYLTRTVNLMRQGQQSAGKVISIGVGLTAGRLTGSGMNMTTLRGLPRKVIGSILRILTTKEIRDLPLDKTGTGIIIQHAVKIARTPVCQTRNATRKQTTGIGLCTITGGDRRVVVAIDKETVLAKEIIAVVIVHAKQADDGKFTDSATHFHNITLMTADTRKLNFHSTAVHRQSRRADARQDNTPQGIGNAEEPLPLTFQVAVLHEDETVGSIVHVTDGNASGKLLLHTAIAGVILIAVSKRRQLICRRPLLLKTRGKNKAEIGTVVINIVSIMILITTDSSPEA